MVTLWNVPPGGSADHSRVDLTTAEAPPDRCCKAARDNGAGALLVERDFVIESMRDDIVRAARAARLPAASEQRAFAEGGGLLSYGTSFTDLYRRAAASVDKILRCAKPGDLPTEKPTKFQAGHQQDRQNSWAKSADATAARCRVH